MEDTDSFPSEGLNHRSTTAVENTSVGDLLQCTVDNRNVADVAVRRTSCARAKDTARECLVVAQSGLAIRSGQKLRNSLRSSGIVVVINKVCCENRSDSAPRD